MKHEAEVGHLTLDRIDSFFEAYDYFRHRKLDESARQPFYPTLLRLIESAQFGQAHPPAPREVHATQLYSGARGKKKVKTRYELGFDAAWHHIHRHGFDAQNPPKPAHSDPEYVHGFQAGLHVGSHANAVNQSMQNVPKSKGGGRRKGRSADYGQENDGEQEGGYSDDAPVLPGVRTPEQRKASQSSAAAVLGHFYHPITSSLQAAPEYHLSRKVAGVAHTHDFHDDPMHDWVSRQIQSKGGHAYTRAEDAIRGFYGELQKGKAEPHELWRWLRGNLANHYKAWSTATQAAKQREQSQSLIQAPAPATTKKKEQKKGKKKGEPEAAPAEPAQAEEPEQDEPTPPEDQPPEQDDDLAPDDDDVAKPEREKEEKPRARERLTYTGDPGEDKSSGYFDSPKTKAYSSLSRSSEFDPDHARILRSIVADELSKLHHPPDWQHGQWSDRELMRRSVLAGKTTADALRSMGLDHRGSNANKASALEQKFRFSIIDRLPHSLVPPGWKGELGRRETGDDAAPHIESVVRWIFGLQLTEEQAIPVFYAWLRKFLD